jgi:hypothetical protein
MIYFLLLPQKVSPLATTSLSFSQGHRSPLWLQIDVECDHGSSLRESHSLIRQEDEQPSKNTTIIIYRIFLNKNKKAKVMEWAAVILP